MDMKDTYALQISNEGPWMLKENQLEEQVTIHY